MESFYKELSHDTICNITQEPQELQQYNCTRGFIGKSTKNKIIYHHCCLELYFYKNRVSTLSLQQRPPLPLFKELDYWS